MVFHSLYSRISTLCIPTQKEHTLRIAHDMYDHEKLANLSTSSM